jgi:NADH dehydrogenase
MAAPVYKTGSTMLLVVGATGSLGGRITNGLIERGHPVRVLVRPASKHGALAGAGAEVAIGNLKDRPSLDIACRSVQTIITTASASRRGDDSIENVDLQGNLNLIDAAARAGVRHLILTSTLGASESSPVSLFRAKAAAEACLRNSGMTWTVLQPNAFMDVWFGMLIEMPLFSGQPVSLVGEARRRHSFVAEQDVAAFALAAVEHPAARNATVLIGGPEAVTLRDAVGAYEDAGAPRRPIRSVAPGAPIPGLPEPIWGLAAGLESFDSPVPMDETARRYGVTLTTAAAFARSRLVAVGRATR